MSTLSERLKYARKNKRLTQLQVSERTGIHNKTLSGYENGVAEPDLDTLKRLADVYEVTVGYLTGSDEYAKLSEIDMKILEEFRKLDERDQEYMMDLIKRIQKK